MKAHTFENIKYEPFSDKCIAIIFETRNLDYLDWVCNTVKFHLNLPIRFYCSLESNSCVNDVEKIIIPNNIDYNHILKDKSFWDSIEYEYVLIFQHDSFVLRSGIEDFYGYDYIGAPWFWAYGDYKDKRYKDLKDFKNGGNGGFSLRRTQAMIDIINSNPPDYEYEDMYFSNALKNDIPLDIKKSFAVESIYSPNPLGVHQIHKYLKEEEIIKLLE